jgi:hypothetical protein
MAALVLTAGFNSSYWSSSNSWSCTGSRKSSHSIASTSPVVIIRMSIMPDNCFISITRGKPLWAGGVTGDEIGLPRLMANPTARLSLDALDRMERQKRLQGAG